MNYQLLLFIIQYLKFRLIRSTALLGRGIFQNPLSAGVVFYPPSALNDSRVAMGFKTTASAGNEITYIWYLFIFRCFINVVPLKAIGVISQIRPEGDTLTMMSRGCPALPECNSTFFPVLINSSFEMHILTLEIFAGMRVFSFVIATICINAYTWRDCPLKERAIAHHEKKIFEAILLWQWILPLVAVADCLPLAFWLTAQLSLLFLKMSFSSHDAVCFSGESASCWEGWNLICM